MAFCTKCGAQMEGAFCSQCGARAGGEVPPSAAASSPTPPPADPGATAPAPPPPQKSRLWLWLLAGCGGLLAIVLILMVAFGLFIGKKASELGGNPGFAAAKLAASLNPNIEVVGADEAAGKITLREKKTGKTVTLDFRDIQKGRISFEGSEGERIDIAGEGEKGSFTVESRDGKAEFGAGSLAGVPGWVPRYPGGEATGTFTASGKNQDSGAFQLRCSGSVQQVAGFYEQALKSAGMKVDKQAMTSGGDQTVVLHAAEEGGGRELTATVSRAEGGTVAHIIYTEK